MEFCQDPYLKFLPKIENKLQKFICLKFKKTLYLSEFANMYLSQISKMYCQLTKCIFLILTNVFVLYWQMYLCTLVQNVPCNAAFLGSISLYKVTSKNSMWQQKIVSSGTNVQVLHICQTQGKMKFQFRSIINLLVTRAAQGHPPVSMRHWWILPSQAGKTVFLLPWLPKSISSICYKCVIGKEYSQQISIITE